MEHFPTAAELLITSQMDFLVPLKQLGVITRAVLECIHCLHSPRRIIVIAPLVEEKLFRIVVDHWEVEKVEFMAEESFFAHLGITIEKLLQEYDANREGDQREPGWWIQQLIKLGASHLPDISENYVVWDGDLIAVRRWKLCEVDNFSGKINFYIAVLQGKAKSHFNTEQYAASMKSLTKFEPLEPSESGTFVAHHMVFNKAFTKELLSLIVEKQEDHSKPWPLIIMASSRVFYRFSEYKTYATFMLRYHPDSFHYHPLSNFGEGGLRFRKAIPIVDDILNSHSFTNGGLSYRQVKHYVEENWKRISNCSVAPAYIQLDHVYGLDPSNLNIFVSSGTTSVDTTVTSLSQEEQDDLTHNLLIVDDDEEMVLLNDEDVLMEYKGVEELFCRHWFP